MDGRVLRGERNREAIVQALLALVGEGKLQPTAEEVAERAGVKVRTVFRHFRDMAGLHSEIVGRMRSEIVPMMREVKRDGSAAERLRSLIDVRAQAFERIAPYKRSADSQRWRIEYIQKGHEESAAGFRAQLQSVVPELHALSEPIQAAIELLLSFEAWSRLRTDQHLSVEQAREVMEEAVLALAPESDA